MRTEKLYKNEEWLKGKYWDEGLSIYKICKLCNRSNRTIWKWLNKHSILIRSRGESVHMYHKKRLGNKNYNSKDWLEKKYLEEKLSTTQIGKLCGVTFSTIHKWMIKFNIPRRSPSQSVIIQCNLENADYHNKGFLKQKYISDELSTGQIGKLCGVYGMTIRKWLKKHNILRRTFSKSQHLRQANHCKLSQEAIEWISGEMLGDACLQSSSIYSAKFSYGSKYPEYIRYVSDTLKSFGIKQGGRIIKQYHKEMDCYSYRYASLRYVELLPIYKKWYPNNKKIVPKDVKLTKLTCRQWVIGDGCLHKPKKWGNPYIVLSTNGFPSLDVEWLVKQLIKIGFKATRLLCNNSIHISSYSTKDFINYIKPSPVKCYNYKFNY